MYICVACWGSFLPFITAPKHKAGSSDGMEVKLGTVKRAQKEGTQMNTSRVLRVVSLRSTVVTIIKARDPILEHVESSAPMKLAVITQQCSGLITERDLLLVQCSFFYYIKGKQPGN